MPVLSNSSRHSAWRSVSPERASESSAAGCSPAMISSGERTAGAGTASTVKGPVTRAFWRSTTGWS